MLKDGCLTSYGRSGSDMSLAGRRQENRVSMDGRPKITLVLTKHDSW